ncbi:MAG: hypothetical protein MRY76_11770 [Pseudomonadales bacterium]|nr:hypothetical protein [Pseudomonadales bacterium]
MSIFIAIAAAGATYMTGLQTALQPSEAEALGIEISVTNLAEEARHPYPLYTYEVDLSQFSECPVRGVWVQFSNDRDELVFSASIQEEFGVYHFLLLEEFHSASSLGITCDAGPDALDPSYRIELHAYTPQ